MQALGFWNRRSEQKWLNLGFGGGVGSPNSSKVTSSLSPSDNALTGDNMTTADHQFVPVMAETSKALRHRGPRILEICGTTPWACIAIEDLGIAAAQCDSTPSWIRGALPSR